MEGGTYEIEGPEEPYTTADGVRLSTSPVLIAAVAQLEIQTESGTRGGAAVSSTSSDEDVVLYE